MSKGNCLKRFYTLFNSVLDFFQESNPELYNKLKSSKTDIAYPTEMFSKFNEVNLQLQGDEISLIKPSPPSWHSSQNYSSTAGTLDAANSVSFLVCLTWRRKQE